MSDLSTPAGGGLPKLPAFKVPAVQVLTFYNGMPTRSVERTLTDRIERWVNQSPGAANVESRSVTGVSVVRVYFREDVDPNTAITMSSSLTDAARRGHNRRSRP